MWSRVTNKFIFIAFKSVVKTTLLKFGNQNIDTLHTSVDHNPSQVYL